MAKKKETFADEIAGITTGTAIAFTQKDRLLGHRTVFHGQGNAISRGFGFKKKGRLKEPVGKEAAIILQKQAKRRGIKTRFGSYMAIPGKPDFGTAFYPGRRHSYSREFVNRKAVLDQANKGLKQILFVSEKEGISRGFVKSGGQIAPLKMKFGEAEFRQKFVKEISVDPFEDRYHRPLKERWYAKSGSVSKAMEKASTETAAFYDTIGQEARAKRQGARKPDRYRLDIRKGVRETASEAISRSKAISKRIAEIPEIWKDPWPAWPKDRTLKDKRIFLVKDILGDIRRAKLAVSPKNLNFEASYYTFKDIKPTKIVGSKHFKSPGFNFRNLLANPKRFLLGAGLVAAGAVAAKIAVGSIAKSRKSESDRVIYRRIRGKIVPIRVKK